MASAFCVSKKMLRIFFEKGDRWSVFSARRIDMSGGAGMAETQNVNNKLQ